MSGDELNDFASISRNAMDDLAIIAFKDPNLNPIKRAMSLTDALFTFSELFTYEIHDWLSKKPDQEKRDMTIRYSHN